MDEVYRARDSSLKREVTLKVLPSFVSRDPDRLLRFEQEAHAAAAVDHPNILAVHQFGVVQGAPHLALARFYPRRKFWRADLAIYFL